MTDAIRTCAAGAVAAFTLALLPIMAAHAQQPAQQDLGITLDGRIGEAEWKASSSRDMEGGGKVHLMVRDKLLYVGIRGPAAGTAHVCVNSGEQVRLLHVSAAVGSATYSQGEVGWRLQSPFAWSLRDPASGGAASIERAAYLQKEGWVGTVSRMGPDREIVIDRSRFGSNRLRLAVAYIALTGDNKPGPVSRWPDTRDSCADPATIAGPAPQNAKFLVNDWAVVE
jgi:hypothetical protein